MLLFFNEISAFHGHLRKKAMQNAVWMLDRTEDCLPDHITLSLFREQFLVTSHFKEGSTCRKKIFSNPVVYPVKDFFVFFSGYIRKRDKTLSKVSLLLQPITRPAVPFYSHIKLTLMKEASSIIYPLFFCSRQSKTLKAANFWMRRRKRSGWATARDKTRNSKQ